MWPGYFAHVCSCVLQFTPGWSYGGYPTQRWKRNPFLHYSYGHFLLLVLVSSRTNGAIVLCTRTKTIYWISYMLFLNALECCLVLVWFYLPANSFPFVNFPSRHRFRSSLVQTRRLGRCESVGSQECYVFVVKRSILQPASYRTNLR